jgi:hypothetical protein
MCANVSFILMNVNRYMLIGREHNSILEHISKWDFKWVVGLTIVSSGLINVGHIFQYALNDGYSFMKIYGFYIMQSDLSYPSIELEDSLSMNIYLLVYFIVNYFMFCIVNTGVEVTLVRKLHSELEDKKKRLEGMSAKPAASSSSSITTAPISFRKRRKQEIEERAEQRAIIMVVINALINLLFRLPELFVLFSISTILFSDLSFWRFFKTFRSLTLFTTDLTYFTYILTFSTNFLVYYLFNLKFKQTFSEWTHTKKRN